MVDLRLGACTAPLLHGGRSARPPHLAHAPRSSPLRRQQGLRARCVSGVSIAVYCGIAWRRLASQGSVQR